MSLKSIGVVVALMAIESRALAQTNASCQEGRLDLNNALAASPNRTIEANPSSEVRGLLTAAAAHFESGVNQSAATPPRGCFMRLAYVDAMLGKPIEATRILERLNGTFLLAAPDEDSRGWEELAVQHLQTTFASFTISAPSAWVKIDGEPITLRAFRKWSAKATVYVDIGKHEIEIEGRAGERSCLVLEKPIAYQMPDPLDGTTCESTSTASSKLVPEDPSACTESSQCASATCTNGRCVESSNAGQVFGAVTLGLGAVGLLTGVGLLIAGLAATPPTDFGTAGWWTVALSGGTMVVGSIALGASTPTRNPGGKPSVTSLMIGPGWLGLRGTF